MSESDPSSAPTPGWAGPDPIIDREALDRLFSVTYEELRRLASQVKRSDWATSISPTTLVNEAWMKLAASPAFRSTSPLHFKRIAARAMRQVLVEAARRRHAARRGGEDAMFVTFDESIGHNAAAAHDLLALDSALEDLARINPRQAAMVEWPVLRRPRRRRGGGAAGGLRSDHPSRLARGESLARGADRADA